MRQLQALMVGFVRNELYVIKGLVNSLEIDSVCGLRVHQLKMKSYEGKYVESVTVHLQGCFGTIYVQLDLNSSLGGRS